jgi:WhiB family redox-sensing transcriptional regulator
MRAWWVDASCQVSPTKWFYPAREELADLRKALRVCADCPVRRECLREALATHPPDDWGVWGGTTRQQRRRIRNGVHVNLDPRRKLGSKPRARV